MSDRRSQLPPPSSIPLKVGSLVTIAGALLAAQSAPWMGMVIGIMLGSITLFVAVSVELIEVAVENWDRYCNPDNRLGPQLAVVNAHVRQMLTQSVYHDSTFGPPRLLSFDSQGVDQVFGEVEGNPAVTGIPGLTIVSGDGSRPARPARSGSSLFPGDRFRDTGNGLPLHVDMSSRIALPAWSDLASLPTNVLENSRSLESSTHVTSPGHDAIPPLREPQKP
jgi:hypothetical protein